MKRIALARKLREQIHGFLGIFSPHFSKPQMRFIEQMIYGIQASQDVKISSITRALGEETTAKKTAERLSRNLQTPGLGQKVNEVIVAHGARRMREDTLIIIDMSDIRKEYAERMPYLAHVRDGSRGEIVKGYWTCSAIACQPRSRKIIPIHQRLWSAEAPDFESENTQILQVIDTIRTGSNGKGTYVLDRGGDRGKLIIPFMQRGIQFIIRLKGDRHLKFRGKARAARDIAEGCQMLYADTVVKEDGGKERAHRLEYGYRAVKLAGRSECLFLVVVRGYGREPILLLTDKPLRKNRNILWGIVSGYLTRWLIEEATRFIKQSYSLEDIRVMKYERLRNLVALVMAAAYFTAVWLGEALKLAVLATRVARIARRFFGIPDFHYYALADGISTLLMYLGSCLRNASKSPTPGQSGQMLLLDYL